MGNLLSVEILSVIVAYFLTLFVFRLAVAGLAAATAVPAVDLGDATDTGIGYERPARGSLTSLALIVPVVGILWMGLGTSPNPPWSEMFAESLSDLGYVLGFAMFFPRSDVIGLGTRRAKLWTGMGFFVLGTVLLHVPRFAP